MSDRAKVIVLAAIALLLSGGLIVVLQHAYRV
jgi:hypothetical protein